MLGMFGIILISVCTFMHVYVFVRAASVPMVKHYFPLKYLILTGVFLWVLFFLTRIFRHGDAGPFAGVLEFTGMGWMALLFLLFVSLLAVDLLTAFGLLFPRIAPSLRGLALNLGGTLAILALIQGIRPPLVQDWTVKLPGLPSQFDGKVIVALSDTHLGTQLGKRWLAGRIRQVQELKPDLVVLLGDILDGHDGAISQLLPILRRLTAPLGVWAVLGNHEFYRGAGKCMALLEGAGVSVLRNRWAEAAPGLIIAGVDDLTAGRRFGRDGIFFSKTLAARPPGVTVFLSHSPWEADKAAAAGVDLMLSGHTHGGQIWPFGYLVRRVYPLFHGMYDSNGMKVIVSRGTGTWGPRMRLWQPGEIMRITLRSSQ